MTCIHGNEDCPNARCREEATAPRAATSFLCGCVFAAGRPPSWCGMHEPLQLESSQDAALMVGDDLSSHPGSGKLLASQPIAVNFAPLPKEMTEEVRRAADDLDGLSGLNSVASGNFIKPSAAYNFPVFFKPEDGHAPAAYSFPVMHKVEWTDSFPVFKVVEVSEAWRQAIAENDQRDLAALTVEAVAAWQNWWLAQDAESDE